MAWKYDGRLPCPLIGDLCMALELLSTLEALLLASSLLSICYCILFTRVPPSEVSGMSRLWRGCADIESFVIESSAPPSKCH